MVDGVLQISFHKIQQQSVAFWRVFGMFRLCARFCLILLVPVEFVPSCDSYVIPRARLSTRALPSRKGCYGKEVRLALAAPDVNDEEGTESDRGNRIIFRGSDDDELDGAIWEDLESGKPPEWMVMKELLGINIFTYILAALIAFFLGMNFFIGPGWLGQLLGMPGVGEFSEVSDSFPDTIDLSNPEFRL